MTSENITPNLWFHTSDGKTNQVTAYYSEIFGNGFESGQAFPLGNTPSGNAEMCEIKFFGKKYMVLCTAIEHHPFNDSFSLVLLCENQEEIDRFWHYFTAEGKASMCGWCQDKFGLRWQIIPVNFGELMSKPNGHAVMSKQTKIIIAEYLP